MKKINELSYEELMNVYHNCKAMQDIIIDYCESDGMIRLDEMLCGVPKSASYQLASYSQGEHFKLCKSKYDLNASIIEDTIQWLENNECMRYALENEEEVLQTLSDCLRYQKVIDEYGYSINLKTEDYNYMFNYISEHIYQVERAIYKALMSEYEYCMSDEYQEMVLTDEVGMQFFDGWYIENGNVYEHIERTVMHTNFASDYAILG